MLEELRTMFSTKRINWDKKLQKKTRQRNE